jgi:hypothetical protein
LFLDAGDHLRGLACDMIYTLPPAALYALTGTRLSTIFGSQPQMLPMIPVARRSIGEDERGIAKLIETIDRRLSEAGATRDQAFDSEETVKRLCVASGGYLRNLITLAQTATNYLNDLPITRDAVEQTIRDARDGFIRSVHTPQQWQLLRNIAETGQITETEDCLFLLENFAVLEYRDQEGPWYDVNPVIREARQLKT